MNLTMTASTGGVPRLCAGDRLSRDEFERRHAAMPECKKAELIEGVVFWRVDDAALDWFALRGDQYAHLSADHEGVIRCEVFPGLWLDVPVLLAQHAAAVLRRLAAGLNEPGHAAFVASLLRP
jgi:hypothetical protein